MLVLLLTFISLVAVLLPDEAAPPCPGGHGRRVVPRRAARGRDRLRPCRLPAPGDSKFSDRTHRCCAALRQPCFAGWTISIVTSWTRQTHHQNRTAKIALLLCAQLLLSMLRCARSATFAAASRWRWTLCRRSRCRSWSISPVTAAPWHCRRPARQTRSAPWLDGRHVCKLHG